MLQMNLQLFGGRGGGSGSGGGGGGAQIINDEMTLANSGYESYDTAYSADQALQKSTNDWEQGLTTEQEDAIRYYTGTYGYDDINDYLRGKTDSPSQKDIDAAAEIESAINNYELTDPMVFHRGGNAKLLNGADNVQDIQKMVGSVVVDRGFTSTSSNKSDILGGDITYHIATPAGKGSGAYIKNLSQFKGESEFLFNSGSAFKIIGAYDDYGRVNVNLQYIGRTSQK